jgi:hypothetical protein
VSAAVAYRGQCGVILIIRSLAPEPCESRPSPVMTPVSESSASPRRRLRWGNLQVSCRIQLLLDMIADDEIDNYELFRDCLSTPLVEKFAHGGKKERVRRRAGNGRRKGEVTRAKVEAAAEENEGGDAEELADFIDVSLVSYLLE